MTKTIEEIRQGELERRIKADLVRLSSYIMSDLIYLYTKEVDDISPDNVVRNNIVLAILNHRYGTEHVHGTIKKYKLSI